MTRMPSVRFRKTQDVHSITEQANCNDSGLGVRLARINREQRSPKGKARSLLEGKPL